MGAEIHREVPKSQELFITPDHFQQLLPGICDNQTSADPGHWTQDNPLFGQCAVVATVAQSVFGGTLLRASLEQYPEFALMRSHYVNKFSDGTIHDFTKPQFGDRYPIDLTFEERSRGYVLGYPETQQRFALLSLRLAKELTKNPLFEDPLYQQCFKLALSSECQKMRFGAVLVKDGIIVAQGVNHSIEELKSLCDPTCIRLNIQSRKESMIGACGHAEEWALTDARDKGINPKECDMYVAGVDMKGMPWMKNKAEATCLRCAVQMHYAKVQSVNMPVVDHWEGISSSQAVMTARAYAMGEKNV